MASSLKEFSVVGRRRPTDTDPSPKIYRMRIFAPDHIRAKSRFFYFLRKVVKTKKTTCEILGVNEIFEVKPDIVKNYGVVLRYDSRSGTTNIYKEFRDTTRCGAVAQLYNDMAGRHRARFRNIQIIEVREVAAKDSKRRYVYNFHNNSIKFPLPHRIVRAPNKAVRQRFAYSRPQTHF
eukprot:CAMPEP_0177648252 /NCGR_PEP_ID=MMETSP0447-20121125/10732_1 /TAXON_ID=0 /ORGANISM="Stygamoeba regulata, Strain BSH-02190019" /LENGTH=177 /DNA_ID=CAMNT_0019150887 /DNA_START=24 /DNA_END=557 /DNA_ORIENTATION=-